MRPVVYLAHPVRTGPGLQENLQNARLWLRWLFQHDRSRVYIAPWIAEVESWLEAGEAEKPEVVELALQDDETVVANCQGILLVGGYGVTQGMGRELAVAEEEALEVLNWTTFRSPSDLPEGALPWK